MGTLGGSVANNDPAACYPSAVLALGATVHTTQRKIAADDFFTGMFSTALNAGELITAISFPIPKRAAYMKFKQAASRFALVGVAIAQFDDGVRVAVTGTARGALRLPEFERALHGRFVPEALHGLKVAPALMSADMHADADYRAHLAAVIAGRVVQRALETSP